MFSNYQFVYGFELSRATLISCTCLAQAMACLNIVISLINFSGCIDVVDNTKQNLKQLLTTADIQTFNLQAQSARFNSNIIT